VLPAHTTGGHCHDRQRLLDGFADGTTGFVDRFDGLLCPRRSLGDELLVMVGDVGVTSLLCSSCCEFSAGDSFGWRGSLVPTPQPP
jgi:hypothetical protein